MLLLGKATVTENLNQISHVQINGSAIGEVHEEWVVHHVGWG
jgi:hypothetical protein